MSHGASELNPMRQDRSQRFPKACKIQMFNPREQVWVDAVNNSLRGGATGNQGLSAIINADRVLEAFDKRFG